jgi:hypothetical protein
MTFCSNAQLRPMLEKSQVEVKDIVGARLQEVEHSTTLTEVAEGLSSIPSIIACFRVGSSKAVTLLGWLDAGGLKPGDKVVQVYHTILLVMPLGFSPERLSQQLPLFEQSITDKRETQ